MKTAKLASLVLALALLLCSCTSYVSSYSATAMVRSNINDRVYLKFGSFNGTLVLPTKMTGDKAEGDIHYKASLEEGEVSVYYDIYGTKELLFTIAGGDSIEARSGYVERDKTIQIIFETDEKARGGEFLIDFK